MPFVKGHKINVGKKRTKKQRLAIAKRMKNRVVSKETREKMSKAKKGIPSEKHNSWKGDDASYRAKHIWIVRRKGKAKKCKNCGKEKGRIEWANIDHKYRRIIDDYIQMCKSCHKKFDLINNRKYSGEQ